MRLIILAFALALCPGLAHATENGESTVTLETHDDDPRQIVFDVGLRELAQGRYTSAAQVFEQLHRQTGSPRVQLEHARSLYLAKDYTASREVFNAVMDNQELPWAVRRNVRAYLDEIDLTLGYVKFAVELVSDSNPLNFTDNREIDVAGYTLNLVEPADNDEIYGLKYTMTAAQAFDDAKDMIGFMRVSFSDFANGRFDRWDAEGVLMAKLQPFPKLRLKLGLERSLYGGHTLYDFPYVGLVHTPDPIHRFRMTNEIRVGRLDVARADYLDADNLQLSTRVTRNLANGFRLTSNASLEAAETDNPAFSYLGGKLGGSVSFPLDNDWGGSIAASVGKRNYQATNPLFLRRRMDQNASVSLGVSNEKLELFGFSPEIGVSYEQTHSSIAFYSFDKVSLYLRASQ